MEQNNINLTELLDYIDPASCNYAEWTAVGMALCHEGYSAEVWDSWSKRDAARYHAGECAKKWRSFGQNPKPVTGGTIYHMACEGGYSPQTGSELEWDSVINDELVVIDKNWIEGTEIVIPDEWQPERQLIKYLETLFDASENVGYVTETWEKDGKYLPTKGCWDRTSGELIEALSKCGGDIGAVLGDYTPAAGAWIRFNPLDGKGVRNENVSDFRYALVESDETDIDKQNSILRSLELPIACLVYSGGKSLHAIVRIDAASYEEYRKRVDYLYNVCMKNGIKVDSQNRNPSRLSRMPGVIRGGKKQYLLDTNIGKSDWNEWKEWIESVNDDLPDPESLESVWQDMPQLSPPLIDGVLRQGHKMLIAGPSKAGKSFSLTELCAAIAEGGSWNGWECAKGRVLYVNLELDRASCMHRFKDVYSALGIAPKGIGNIDIWNLRGKSVPMDKLAPKLIRRAYKKNYIAVIIDPIYKVITGDENSADQMANFCNQFDKVCTELGCAVIYCHHHSKGAQGGKRSMDRASGSGVFARDPDAMLDLIELELTDDARKMRENATVCDEVCALIDEYAPEDWRGEVSQDDLCSAQKVQWVAAEFIPKRAHPRIDEITARAAERSKALTAWRIEGTLREFPKFPPVNLWFDYPVHRIDSTGALSDLSAVGDAQWNQTWRQNFPKKKSPEDKKKERAESLSTAYEACSINGAVTLKDLAEYMGVTEKTVRRRIKNCGDFWIDDSVVGRKN